MALNVTRAPVPSSRQLSRQLAGPAQRLHILPAQSVPGGHRRRISVAAAAGKKINEEQLEVEIQDRDRPLIVDFYATWCGPCVLLAQELDKVEQALGDKIRILKVDVDENPRLSSQLRIEGLPTIVFIPKDNSRPALRTEGLLPAEQIMEIVKEMTTAAAPAPQQS